MTDPDPIQSELEKIQEKVLQFISRNEKKDDLTKILKEKFQKPLIGKKLVADLQCFC